MERSRLKNKANESGKEDKGSITFNDINSVN